MQVVHFVVQIERSWVASSALGFSKKEVFAGYFQLRCFSSIQVSKPIQLWRRRKVKHVLGLRHVWDHAARQLLKALLHRPNWITVKIRGALFELSKILNRAQAPLRAVNLLIE